MPKVKKSGEIRKVNLRMKTENLRVKHEFLTALRVAVPFLQEIPDERYFGLDTTELYMPTEDVVAVRENLEQKLGQNVMTYNRDVFQLGTPLTSHLCANIAGAQLTKEQFGLVRDYEKRFTEERVSFVVYQKPVKLIYPQTSPLTKFYGK